jgi:Protein of unknown function (DUF664)
MQADDLRVVMVRDLRSLEREVAAYPDDEGPWRAVPGISNTGGTLALHLAGNVRHFIGAVLGGSGFVRDRDGEFGRRGVTRAELGREIALAIAEAERVFPMLTPERMAAEFPIEVGGRRMATARWLSHLSSHFAYHLGQIDYHRRMVAPGSGVVGTMGIAEL